MSELGASAVEPLPDDSWQRRWKCAACESSFAFYSGNPRFLAYCTNCVVRIRAHGEKNAPKTVADDTPEAWAVIADDWLDKGANIPEAVTAKDREAFERWASGGPSTPAAMRYARSRIPRR
jgi:hypothetical protein